MRCVNSYQDIKSPEDEEADFRAWEERQREREEAAEYWRECEREEEIIKEMGVDL